MALNKKHRFTTIILNGRVYRVTPIEMSSMDTMDDKEPCVTIATIVASFAKKLDVPVPIVRWATDESSSLPVMMSTRKPMLRLDHTNGTRLQDIGLIARGMRHLWQMKHNPELLAKRPINPEDSNERLYCETEIDADAFVLVALTEVCPGMSLEEATSVFWIQEMEDDRARSLRLERVKQIVNETVMKQITT